MFICICAQVSDRAVDAALEAGARTLGDLTMGTGACTQCRCCKDYLEECLARHRGTDGADTDGV